MTSEEVRHCVESFDQVLMHGFAVSFQVAIVNHLERQRIWMLRAYFHVFEETVHSCVVELGLLASCILLDGFCIPVQVKHLAREDAIARGVVLKR